MTPKSFVSWEHPTTRSREPLPQKTPVSGTTCQKAGWCTDHCSNFRRTGEKRVEEDALQRKLPLENFQIQVSRTTTTTSTTTSTMKHAGAILGSHWHSHVLLTQDFPSPHNATLLRLANISPISLHHNIANSREHKQHRANKSSLQPKARLEATSVSQVTDAGALKRPSPCG